MPKAWTIYRTGSEHFSLTEAHPYHVPVGRLDHTGAGTYTTGVDPACPLCRQERTVGLARLPQAVLDAAASMPFEPTAAVDADALPSDACPSCGTRGDGEPCDPFCGA